MNIKDILKTKMYGYQTYEQAKEKFNWDQSWELFDGDKVNFNITHECIDRHPAEEAAVRIKFEDGHTEEYSFGTISNQSSQFANALESMGVNFGDRVAVMLDPSFEFYVTVFGTLKRGAVVVPCFPLFGPDAIKQRLNDSGAKVLVTTPQKKELIDKNSTVDIIVTGSQLNQLLEIKSKSYQPNTASGDISVYQYTSGTTRKYAEAVKHYHRSIVNLMPAAIFGRGLKKGDRFFCPSSPAWGHGLWIGTFAPLSLGVTLHTYSGKFDVNKVLQAMEEFKISHISAAATVYRMIKTSDLAKNYNIGLEKINYGGEPMDLSTFEFLKEMFGVSPISGYGSTEVGPVIYNYAGFENYHVKPGSLGKPMPGVEIKLLDEAGNDIPCGQIGEIAIKRRGDWLRTKDAGVEDNDGYFWHKGRVDDIIISAGWTISPYEVEDALLLHPSVKEVAVVGASDNERGEIVKAYVVLKNDPNNAIEGELQNLVKDRLSKHEYPRAIEFVQALPRTEGGKIIRKNLK